MFKICHLYGGFSFLRFIFYLCDIYCNFIESLVTMVTMTMTNNEQQQQASRSLLAAILM